MSGVHVACVYRNYLRNGGTDGPAAGVVWSEQMLAAGATAKAAPAYTDRPERDRNMSVGFEVANETGAAIVIAFGGAPDPVIGPTLFVRSGETRQLVCRAGDRIAWAVA